MHVCICIYIYIHIHIYTDSQTILIYHLYSVYTCVLLLQNPIHTKARTDPVTHRAQGIRFNDAPSPKLGLMILYT